MKYILLLCLSIFVLVRCNFNNENKEVESKLAKLEVGSTFSLDTMNTKKEWDQFYIAGPYQYEALRKKIDIPEFIKNITLTEGHCVLIFMKDNQMVSFSVIGRDNVDFSDCNDSRDFNDDHYSILPNAVFVLKDGRRAVLKSKTN